MPVANALLIDPNSFDGHDTISRLEPPGVELVVGHDEEEDDPQTGGQTAVDQKDDFPRRDGGAVLAGTDRDPVRHQSAEDLTEAVEREPKPRAGALFFLGVPLGREESETRCDCGLEDAEEDYKCDVRKRGPDLKTSPSAAYDGVYMDTTTVEPESVPQGKQTRETASENLHLTAMAPL